MNLECQFCRYEQGHAQYCPTQSTVLDYAKLQEIQRRDQETVERLQKQVTRLEEERDYLAEKVRELVIDRDALLAKGAYGGQGKSMANKYYMILKSDDGHELREFETEAEMLTRAAEFKESERRGGYWTLDCVIYGKKLELVPIEVVTKYEVKRG